MLTIHSGPFHPQLEDVFAAVVPTLKKGPFDAVAVVAPSGGLKRRAEAILSSRGAGALNVHFETMGFFAESIVSAAGGLSPLEKGKERPVLISDGLFFDALVRQILKEDRPFEALDDLAVPDGFPPSVRATLRDLIDAGVDPDLLLQAVNEHDEFNIPEVDTGSLKQLIHLYRLYLARLRRLNVASRSELLRDAADMAPSSPYLRSFRAIIFYGFYDLTGLQVALVDAVSRHHETHFFFPYLHGHPDHAFGARFRGDVLDKIPHEETLLATAEEPIHTFRGPGRLEMESEGPFRKAVRWEAGGPEARVINVSGQRDEAWTVASEILRLHDAGVPFSQMAVVARTRERLARFPAVFDEREVPFLTSWTRRMAEMPQVEIGLALLHHRAFGTGTPPRAADFRASGEPSVAPWPASASWPERVDAALAALDAFLAPTSDLSASAWAELRKAMAALRDFARLSPAVTREEFLETLRDKWCAQEAPAAPPRVGVSVLHAEAARGLPFDAVFVVGVEERIFPRVIREDPFLRDKTRWAIVQTIGNKIGEKMLALAEERLLFNLILNAARRNLFLTYQRSDDEGKIVGASSFLRRLVDEWGIPFDDSVNVVPRRLSPKLEVTPPETLGVRDAVSALLIDGRTADAVRLAAAVGRDGRALARSMAAVKRLEAWEGATAYDGLVGSAVGAGHLAREGMSPGGLESFARCPFQYFVGRVLRLAPVPTEVAPDEIPRDVKGRLIHSFLESFYRRCLETFGSTWPATPPQDVFDEVFDGSFATTPAGVYPLLWTAFTRALRTQVFQMISSDFATLAERGLVPALFEQAHTSATLDPAFGDVRFVGKIDRIDVGAGRARVVDYKTGRAKFGRVSTSIVRGEKAQPSIYLLMAAEFLASRGIAVDDIDFTYLHLDPDQAPSELDAAAWAVHRAEAIDAVTSQLRMIRDGLFPIFRGDHCENCDAASICRQTDSISVFRIEKQLAPIRDLKSRKARSAS